MTVDPKHQSEAATFASNPWRDVLQSCGEYHCDGDTTLEQLIDYQRSRLPRSREHYEE